MGSSLKPTFKVYYWEGYIKAPSQHSKWPQLSPLPLLHHQFLTPTLANVTVPVGIGTQHRFSPIHCMNQIQWSFMWWWFIWWSALVKLAKKLVQQNCCYYIYMHFNVTQIFSFTYLIALFFHLQFKLYNGTLYLQHDRVTRILVLLRCPCRLEERRPNPSILVG